MPWLSFKEAMELNRPFLVFVHSPTLPLSRRIKEKLEELNIDAAIVDWHREPEIARRLTEYPPRVLAFFPGWKIAPMDGVSPDKLKKIDPTDLSPQPVKEELPLSWRTLREEILGELSKNLLFLYDPYRAGFGYSPKFTESDAINAATALWCMDRDIRYRMIAEDTLNVILNSPMTEGGLVSTFSYSPDWREPSKEYTAEHQAKIAASMIYAAKSIPNPYLTKRAAEAIEAAEKLRILSAREAFVLAWSYAITYQALHKKRLLEAAQRLLRSAEPRETYIEDACEKGHALLELYMATGSREYLKEATECAQELKRFLHQEAFVDTTLDLPPRYPVRANARACELLLKIHAITGEEQMRDLATKVLCRIAKKGVDRGIEGLSLVVPMIIALYGCMKIELKGQDPELHLAAMTLINPIRVIVHRDAPHASASLCFGEICFPETRDPNQLRDYIVSLLIRGGR